MSMRALLPLSTFPRIIIVLENVWSHPHDRHQRNQHLAVRAAGLGRIQRRHFAQSTAQEALECRQRPAAGALGAPGSREAAGFGQGDAQPCARRGARAPGVSARLPRERAGSAHLGAGAPRHEAAGRAAREERQAQYARPAARRDQATQGAAPGGLGPRTLASCRSAACRSPTPA